MILKSFIIAAIKAQALMKQSLIMPQNKPDKKKH